MKRLKDQADLVIILAIGIFLRARIITKHDFWFDEAFTGLLTKVPKETFWKIISEDTHPPLYSILIRGWTQLFGSNDLSIRSLSLVFGVLTIVVVYFLVKKMFGKDAASIAALLTSLNPFLITYSIEARSYSFYAFLVALATYLLVCRKTILFTIVAIVGIFTHFVFFAYLGILMVYYFYLLLTKEIKPKYQVINWLLIIIAFAVSFHIATPKQDLLNIDWVQRADFTNIPNSLAAYSFGVRAKSTGDHGVNNINILINSRSAGMIIFTLLTVGITVLIQREKDNKENIANVLLTVFLILIPQLTLVFYGILTGNNIYIERYLTPSAIFYVVILANILVKLFRFESAAMIILLLLLALTRVEKPTYYTGMKMVANEFERTGEKIVFTSPVDFVVAKYYMYNNRQNLRIYNPQEPTLDYTWWPFVEPEDHLEELNGVLFISPENNRMGAEFTKLEENTDFEKYQVYVVNRL